MAITCRGLLSPLHNTFKLSPRRKYILGNLYVLLSISLSFTFFYSLFRYMCATSATYPFKQFAIHLIRPHIERSSGLNESLYKNHGIKTNPRLDKWLDFVEGVFGVRAAADMRRVGEREMRDLERMGDG